MTNMHTRTLSSCFALSLLLSVPACGPEPKAGSPSPSRPGALEVQPDQKKNPDLPVFETSAAEVQQTFDRVTAEANKKLAELAARDTSKLTFANTIQSLEDLMDGVSLAFQQTDLLKDVHPNQELRDKAYEVVEKYKNWFIEAWANGKVYLVVKAYADTKPRLTPDKKKLLDVTVLTYKRAGFTDQGVIDPRVLTLKREINELESQIGQAIVAANAEKNYFTMEELAGLEQAQLDSLTKEGELYMVQSGNRGALRDVVMSYAQREETRKRAKTISNSRATNNLPLITTLIQKRLALAQTLGYRSWADYRTEVNMSKTGDTALAFVDGVSTKLRPKLEQELSAMAKYIVPGVNDGNNQVDAWDVYFFKRMYETNELKVDYEKLRQYLPYEQVVDGMFRAFEKVFGIKIQYVQNPVVWHGDVRLVKISQASDDDDDEEADDDEEDEEVLGYLYLDMLPRLAEGKMSHFASYGIVAGKKLESGQYRKPVNTLVCNFPVNPDGTPKPLLFGDIETLFHEFGHALHCILGKARFSSQSGFSVPGDFVEVPSGMLENWASDKNVFKQLAIPHPDLTDAFLTETMKAIKNAAVATAGSGYERQFAFGKMDLVIHGYTDAAQIPAPTDPNNLVAITNQVMASVYLPYPEGTNTVTSFNHLLTWGYDAGYYGYAWADSISAEFANLFEESPRGFMDRRLGMRYRKEILEPGASRDVNDSVKAFLGRPLDPERKAFLKRLGVQ